MAEVSLDQAPRKARELFDKGFAAMERGNLDYAMDMLTASLEIEPRLLQARKFLRAAAVRKFKESKGGALSHIIANITHSGTAMKVQTLMKNKPDQALKTAEKLIWADPLDQNLWAVEDAFLLGDNLLVAPVLEAQAKTRSVRLPAGKWFDFWDARILAGATTHTIETPLEKIPLFVRSNSLAPLAGNGCLTLHLYLDERDLLEDAPRLAGQIYNDLGDGYGPARLDRFFIQKTGSRVVLSWQSEGDYPSPKDEMMLAFHGCRPQAILVDGIPANHPTPLRLSNPFQTLSFEVEA